MVVEWGLRVGKVDVITKRNRGEMIINESIVFLITSINTYC